MTDKTKEAIQEMVETAAYLARNDPNSFLLAKNSIDILKARHDMVKAAEGNPAA